MCSYGNHGQISGYFFSERFGTGFQHQSASSYPNFYRLRLIRFQTASVAVPLPKVPPHPENLHQARKCRKLTVIKSRQSSYKLRVGRQLVFMWIGSRKVRHFLQNRIYPAFIEFVDDLPVHCVSDRFEPLQSFRHFIITWCVMCKWNECLGSTVRTGCRNNHIEMFLSEKFFQPLVFNVNSFQKNWQKT